MANSTNLAKVVLFFDVIESGENISELSANSRFHFTSPDVSADDEAIDARWKGGQTGDFPNTFCFKFGENIHSPSGWVAGSAPTENCDLRLAKNNQTGISRFHFRVDISPRNRPRITNLSTNEIRIHELVQRGGEDRLLSLYKNDDVDITDPVAVDLGEVVLRIWRPILTDEEEATYTVFADEFHKDFMHALPKPSRVAALPTSDVRFGLGQATYRKIGGEPERSGTFGYVIKVMELRKRTTFAAKVPHRSRRGSAAEDREQWEMISKEFEKLVTLRHENVVETIEILPGKGGIEPPWLIMEWVEQSLSNYAPSVSQIPILLRQISSGLAYMHEKGFTHRDLKPENILLQGHGSDMIAKIADVGLSKYAGDRNMRTHAGTFWYMAPELWNAKQGYTNAVDMWSFGIIALELFTSWNMRLDMPSTGGAPPSDTLHNKWVHACVLPRRTKAPRYQPLLAALLCIDPDGRWRASTCEQWLSNDINCGRDESFGNEDGTRYIRSGHPTLSTNRAKSLPDTAPWGGSGDS